MNINKIILVFFMFSFTIQAQDYIPIKKSLILEEVENLPIFLTSFSFNPVQKDGKDFGFKIYDLANNRIAKQMKLKENDILYKLDDLPLNDLPNLIAEFSDKDESELKIGKIYKLGIIREKKKKLLNYIIK